jgi:hypothetical protein
MLSDHRPLAAVGLITPHAGLLPVQQFGQYRAVGGIGGQNDAGLFTLDFNDQRYLPFEYSGAVSRWRIELPTANNFFAMNTLTDCILRLNLTACEGGPLLRHAAEAAARDRLPGDGWRLIDVRHELPDAWQRFKEWKECDGCNPRVELRLDRRMFPYLPEHREIVIGGMAILLGDCGPSRGPRTGTSACPCPGAPEDARTIVELIEDDCECPRATSVECYANETWPGFRFGSAKTQIGPIGPAYQTALLKLDFPNGAEQIEELFLFCRYQPASHLCASLTECAQT